MKRKILIIGAVAVGATAAARLRRLNEDDEIIMFERNGYVSFANCGLPYYLGDVITERENLLLQSPESFKARFNVDVRVYNEVISVDPVKKVVRVLNKKTNEEYEEAFDKLILGPGADPIVPPFTGLTESDNIFVLRNVENTDAIFNFLNDNTVNRAVVVGGGFIGVEMAENLIEKGVKEVTLVDLSEQIMNPFDFEMAYPLQKEMEKHGIKFMLGEAVDSFADNGKKVLFKSGKVLESDLTILAIGVRPATKFLYDSGIELDERSKAIIVNSTLQTNFEDIYAAGDSAMIKNFVTGENQIIPLASPANRQARLIADHINGQFINYAGAQGTSVIKVFDLTGSSVGLNEKQLLMMGKEYEAITVHRGNHAGYYPGASTISLKLIFDKETGEIYGAQAIGKDGTEKRIDVISTVQRLKATVSDLTELELAYAPPFSSAKDPVNIAGYVAENVMSEAWKVTNCNEIDDIVANGGLLIDVRTAGEFNAGHIPGAINIEVDELRDRLRELPQDMTTPIYVNCAVGQRAYYALRILKNKGYNNLFNVTGGYTTYCCVKK